ncbi:hypothetical protein DH2020_005704 [Rehmannia glutinosa]|uniref:Acyltransferase-like protein n=1 Tax=Rehmannia glutinosa TaxID=99300 RepID=A0ABR0XGX2_REHGL
MILSNTEYKTCYPASTRIPGSSKLSSNLWANSRDGRSCSSRHRVKNRSFSSGSGFLPENNKENLEAKQELKPLWDDGYGTQTVKDYLEAAKDMIKSDGGPPRWFCPIESGPPLQNSPVLLYLPGIAFRNRWYWHGSYLASQGSGQGFQIRCMHIPVNDRTPYEKLVKFVENAVRAEHASYPNKPIYLVGDSFGACLALSIAASNPTIDLVLILVNPGDPIKMANVINTKNLLTSPAKQIESLILELSSLMTGISSLADILPKQTLIWKLKLLKSAAAYSNSRIHSVKHEVLILASGKDSMLPSKHEAQRLSDLLKNCRVRFFKNNGHTLLMEDGTNLLTVLKGTCTYRRSKRRDPVTDFLPRAFGYHMLLGAEIGSVVEEFLREKNVMVYGMAHPEIFTLNMEEHLQEISGFDYFKVFGATPATSSNFFKLLASKSYVLLYPGGIREALHRKGEEYKLFWPDEPEFVRMAARFGAKIVPFGVVGEDDLVKLFLDYDDLMRIPHVKEMIKRRNQNAARVRVGTEMKEKFPSRISLFLVFIRKCLAGSIFCLGNLWKQKEGEIW